MATWHQQNRPVQLWHPEKWTVVNDPPNAGLSVSRHDSHDEALRDPLITSKAKHAYIIPPHKEHA